MKYNDKSKDYKIEYGSSEWYLYHDYDNEKPIIPLILLSCFLFICKGGIIWLGLIWGKYFIWAHENNEKLNKDPEILEKRRIWIESRNRYSKK